MDTKIAVDWTLGRTIGLIHVQKKNLPDLKSRQIDHCHKYLHWIMYAKLLMGFWSLFAINDWGISMSDKIHFAKKREKKKSQFFNFSDLFLFDLLFFRFLSIDRIFEAIFSLIFCYSKKRFMRRRVFLWALNLILDSIQFRCHCTSQLTSHQMMSKEPKKEAKTIISKANMI